MPKWEQIETALIAKGITPETADWPERSKQWFYAHGGSLDPQTGKIIDGKEKIAKPSEELVKAMTDV